jgi:hypothetical protein
MVIVLCRTVTMIGQTMVIDENIRNDAFGMAHETIAVRKILDEVVANAERSLLEGAPCISAPSNWSPLIIWCSTSRCHGSTMFS